MHYRFVAFAVMLAACGKAGVGGSGQSSAGSGAGATGGNGSSAASSGSSSGLSSTAGAGGSTSGATAGGASSGTGSVTAGGGASSGTGSSSGSATAGGASSGSSSGTGSSSGLSGGTGSSSGLGSSGGASSGSTSGNGACNGSQYQNQDGVCTALTTCTPTQWEGKAPTATSDRICHADTTCLSNAFQSVAPTATSDRQCQGLRTCLTIEYQSLAPTTDAYGNTSDRSCSALAVCDSAHYQSAAPTQDSTNTNVTNRTCSALTTCTATQYQTAAPTQNANGTMYITNRSCADDTVCASSQYQTVAPTATSDRQCGALTTCSGSQYQSVAPTATSDRQCATLTTCSSSQYQTVAPTATSDRQCAALTQCTFAQYESQAPTAASDRQCKALTECTSSQCESVPPTATTNRQCKAATLDITPNDLQILSSVQGQPQSNVTFTASICGTQVNAAWTIDKGALGTFDSNNTASPTFTSTGGLGGLGNISAGFNGLNGKVQVLVQLVGQQNGATSAESSQVVPNTSAGLASLVAGGGIGGVGGEGLGGPVDTSSTTYSSLQATPAQSGTTQGLKFLYPYDGTVWPRGMLAPELQWDWSFGDADAIRIDLYTSSMSYAWTGYFAPPAVLASEGSHAFIRHAIPQDVWNTATNTAGEATVSGKQDQLTVSITLAKGGVAYGPITETWGVARARLSGTIYYQSYGTNLASNYSGAAGTPSAFGAAVLSIRGGDPAPKLVSSYSQCQVCHSVAAKGSRLQVQVNGANSNITQDIDLLASGNTSQRLTNGVGGDGYPGLSPDGGLMLSPNATLQRVALNTSTNKTDNLTTVTTTGLTTVSTNLGVPAFSPDGKKIVFNPQNGVTHNKRELMVLDFDKVSAFSNPIVVADDFKATGDNTSWVPTWPQFFPDSNSIVYQHQVRQGLDTFTGDGYTRKFTEGQLYWASAVASATVTPLNQLNGQNKDGTTYLPHLATASAVTCTADGSQVGSTAAQGDPTHAADIDYNYEPTVNPVSSGGYAWVVFTSRRMYGNEATIPPFCSDPRGIDLHANMTNNTNITTKKLWVAAIDINGNPATDASHPAFYLPAQELLAGNGRGFWVLDPCVADGGTCATGDQCCGGYCQPDSGGALSCTNSLPNGQCSPLQGACNVAQDCCDQGALCVNAFCATQSL